jgi:hypothetical protein
MMLYRSAVLGLLTALVLLVAELGRDAPPPPPRPAEPPTVVDVSRTAMLAAGVPLAALVGARRGERVVAVAGGIDDPGPGATVVPGSYLDVELASASGHRRVLVLVHR